MAGSGIFQSYKKADAELRESGYIKAFLNLLDDFQSLAEPAALTDDSVTGDATIITDAHTWKGGKNPMGLYLDQKSLEAPAEAVGDPGSLKYKWTLKFFLKGDGPVPQDLSASLLNQELVAFAQDQCQNGEMLQYGCDCIPGQVSKSGFVSGTLPSGSKGYNFEVEFYCRYFYRGSALQTRT